MKMSLMIIMLVASVFLIGILAFSIREQHHLTANIIIEAPIEKVWATWSAFSNVDGYVPMIRKAYTVSDKAGDVGHIRRCEFANGAFVEEEIVAWNPGRSFEFFLHKKQRAHIARMQVLSEVAPHKEDTRATITMNYKLALLMRWVPMRSFMQQQAVDHLLGLKYFIEKGQCSDEKTIKLMREAYANFYSTY